MPSTKLLLVSPLSSLIHILGRLLKSGAGIFLPGVWGCPPDSNFPQDWGIKGLDLNFSALYILLKL
jgi:hypothetical protein